MYFLSVHFSFSIPELGLYLYLQCACTNFITSVSTDMWIPGKINFCFINFFHTHFLGRYTSNCLRTVPYPAVLTWYKIAAVLICIFYGHSTLRIWICKIRQKCNKRQLALNCSISNPDSLLACMCTWCKINEEVINKITFPRATGGAKKHLCYFTGININTNMLLTQNLFLFLNSILAFRTWFTYQVDLWGTQFLRLRVLKPEVLAFERNRSIPHEEIKEIFLELHRVPMDLIFEHLIFHYFETHYSLQPVWHFTPQFFCLFSRGKYVSKATTWSHVNCKVLSKHFTGAILEMAAIDENVWAIPSIVILLRVCWIYLYLFILF